jgi:UDP-GlcNAc:undecaprenyl-phosphate GlcNAc-1-phosphate transferase
MVVLLATAIQSSSSIADIAPEVARVHAGGVLYQAPFLSLLLFAALGQLVIGLVDDFRSLDFRIRLVLEILLASALVAGGIQLDILPGWDWLTAPLTVLWIVGLTNAFNLLDNMDGLASGVAAIASVFFAFVAGLVGDLFVCGCFLILVGAVAGFWMLNWHPAKIFLGDAGSNFLGFWIGLLSVIATFKTDQYEHVTLWAPLCILSVPLYDTISVVALRLWQKRSPFEPDRQHFSHRLLDLGFTVRTAVAFIYLVTIMTGLGSLILYFVRPYGAALVLVQIACMLGVIGTLEFVSWSRARRPSFSSSKTEDPANRQVRSSDRLP